MKKILTLLLLYVSVLSCTEKDPLAKYTDPDKAVIPPAGIVIKVMTYNIFSARQGGLNKDKDLEALADVIKAHDPDFVILNEVDSASVRSNGVVHAKALGQLTGMKAAYAVALKFPDGGAYGDAVLSKHPILEEKDFNMSPSPDHMPGEVRAICVIKSKIEGYEFWVAGTHLDHRGDETSRIYQARKLKEITDGLSGRMFLAGDFNARPSSETMSIVFETFQHNYLAENQYTFPSQLSGPNPTSMIDYVLYRKPDKGIQCKGYKVIQSTASDHCAVLATFQIK